MPFTESGVREILSHFAIPGAYVSYTPIIAGHINDTMRVQFNTDGTETYYILQRINTHVFTDPDALMDNILRVTAYLADFVRRSGGDTQRETLTVFPTKDGASYYRTPEGDCMRVYNCVTDTYTLQQIEDAEDFRKAGEAFGRFQNMLADYPSHSLHETIAHFHDTVSRFADLRAAIAHNAAGRLDRVADEIEFCMQREADTHVLVDLLAAGKLPLRVTHNDTKLNNVLFDIIRYYRSITCYDKR